jgi:hypothetical protein
MRSRLVVGLAVWGAVVAPSCGTVDLGSPPADLNACLPSEKFFAQQIWPEFLSKDFGGKHCYDGGCHGAGSPQSMVLAAPASQPSAPLSPEWEAVYLAVSRQMNCTSPSASALIERPSNLNHGGGKLIDMEGAEATLVKMWVAAP